MVSLSPQSLPSADVSVDQLEHGSSPWHDAWMRLRKNRPAIVGAVVLIVITLLCIAGPWFSQSYREQDLQLVASAPSGAHWLGTDVLGRDLFARILFGGRISLMVGLVATVVALTIGVTYGAVAGFLGGKTDAVMMRIVDIIYALPFTIFVILLMVFMKGPAEHIDSWLRNTAHLDGWQGFGNILLLFAAIGAVEWLTMARIVRGQVLSIKRMEFIEAARALGYGRRRIIFRHIIPNVLGPIIVYATLTVPAVMLLEAFLSFLGLGVQPPMSSWGWLIKEGSEKMEEFWWLLVFPGGVFSLTLFSLNFLGDGLRDALDVRASKD
ncbi:MAG: binding-protein-dependent transport system inner rane component [Verrucomicrobia bacterium]|nr:binding-protein-dependent transport system inner rane component [Verrucomicrobiota bacterium]